MKPGRDPFAHYRDLMEAYGFRPSRRLGQNFLLDPSLHRFIVQTAGVGPDDCAFEIGAGLGFLTRELLASAARVVSVEIDARLAALVRAELGAATEPRLQLVEADVLAGEGFHPDVCAAIARARQACRGDLVLAANLPYAVCGPVLAQLALLEDPPARGAVLVQWEMAQRLTAPSGSRTFGALTATLAMSYEATVVRRVGRQVFRPRPAVDSAIVGLRRRDGDWFDRPPDERRAFAQFVRALFGQRRKQLRAGVPAALARIGLPGGPAPSRWEQLRPEALTPGDLLELWRCVRGIA